MPLTQDERQIVIDRLKVYPPNHGTFWGSGQMADESANVATARLRLNPLLAELG